MRGHMASQGIAFLESSLACAERMIHVTLGDVPWNQEADVEGVLKTATARDERAFPTQSAPGADPKTDPRPVQAPPAKYVPTTTHWCLVGRCHRLCRNRWGFRESEQTAQEICHYGLARCLDAIANMPHEAAQTRMWKVCELQWN